MLTALKGALLSEAVEVIQAVEVTQAAQIIELRWGDPQLSCLVTLKDLNGSGPLWGANDDVMEFGPHG